MKSQKRVFSNIPIQIKITGLALLIIMLIVGSISTLVIIMDYQEDIEAAENIALQTAKTLSYMPAVQEAFQQGVHSEELGLVIDSIRQDVDASSIIIRDREQVFLMDSDSIDEPMASALQEEATGIAQMFGNSYVTTVGKGKDSLLVGVSGIQIDYGSYYKMQGTAMVVYDKGQILSGIVDGAKKIIYISLAGILLGLLGSWILARDIRKDMLGLEPNQIASLYLERTAVFRSIREGLVVVDANEEVTMANPAAKTILEIKEKVKGKKLRNVIQSEKVFHTLRDLQKGETVEFEYNGQMLIADAQPVYQEEERIGIIYSIKDKTEIRKMANTLNEVKQYSDDLRAQTHEFKNKLHVLFGLLQLGRIPEALEFLNEESQQQQNSTDFLNQNILDEKVQAILIGKIARASETKVNLYIHPDSSLEPLPDYIGLMPLLTILGNLIDNSLEAVSGRNGGYVSVFTTDYGNDVIFEVTDNGDGIPDELAQTIFQKGYSQKGTGRGYGLYNVVKEISILGGEIEVESSFGEGTTFTVYLKKEIEAVEKGS
ncbi:sensor histidine kinase [Planomicrobium okeanokoites]|uniref:histidine kinase n=1 Tax=Planomicrobium okeanokoites TaxID=244 RepID=A0ABV7KS47_PLAOK|nr:sensor histidine kinase [Planomicrobium okeanokoites]TAA70065.1 sensor histidine kinase [Planomicrobium okeanokoites]